MAALTNFPLSRKFPSWRGRARAEGENEGNPPSSLLVMYSRSTVPGGMHNKDEISVRVAMHAQKRGRVGPDLRGTDTLRTLFSCLFFKNHSKIVRARECTRSKWSLISLHQQYLRKLFHQIPVTHARTNDRCRQNGAHFASNGTASQRLTRFSWLKVFQVAKWKRSTGNF